MKWNFLSINTLLFGVVMLLCSSCKKQTSSSASSSTAFVKVIPWPGNMFSVSGFVLSDGNYLVAGCSLGGTVPGLMVKMDANGNVLWQKTMPLVVAQVYKAIPLSTGGYVVIGLYENSTDYNLNVIRYDNNGNIDDSMAIPAPGPVNYDWPIDMIQLSNGNFAICGAVNHGPNFLPVPFLLIRDPSFNRLYTMLDTAMSPNYLYVPTGMCEAPDGTINIAGTGDSISFFPFLLKCSNNGALVSYTQAINNSLFESPSKVGTTNSGEIVMIDSKTNLQADSGNVVNYFYNSALEFVSGKIVLKTPGNDSGFSQLATITGYPNNGIIRSFKPTSDGGFILCGTVNQGTAQSAASSPTEMYLVKLNANFGIEWANNYLTNSPSLGADACQVPGGGYFICGSQVGLGSNYNMVIIQTNASGNL